jgi:hypothetical protein
MMDVPFGPRVKLNIGIDEYIKTQMPLNRCKQDREAGRLIEKLVNLEFHFRLEKR